MGKAAISKRTVDAAAAGKADYVIWDDGGKETVKGFGLKVTPSGSKIYLYQYRIARPGQASATAPKKYTIGKHGDLTPDQARDRAKALAVLVTQGIDPRQSELDAFAAEDEAKRLLEEKARRDEELLFEKVSSNWLAEYEIGHRPRSYGQARLVINRHLKPALAGLPLPAIARSDIQAILDAIPAAQMASRRTVFAYASIFFSWAAQRGQIENSPLMGMAKPKTPKARDRVLTDREIATIWQASEQLRAPFGAFYRLLILSGQRREEVATMSWSELDRANALWTIPAQKAKNGVAHLVPLSPAMLRELDDLALALQVKANTANPDSTSWPAGGPVVTIGGLVPISCYSQAKRLLDAQIEKGLEGGETFSPWRIHDLRRTMATGFQRLGIRFEVTEAVLNHVSGARGGVAGVYQRHDWKAEKRAALEAWASHLEHLLAGTEKNNVVQLGSRA